MTYYIYSTRTNPVRYVEYNTNSSKNYNVIKRSFVIEGGHGLCNKHFITPEGVVTIVKDEETMQWLKSLKSFQTDEKNGFIRVRKKNENSAKVVKFDMNPKDNCAPLTPKDYVQGNRDLPSSYRSVHASANIEL